MTPIHSPIGFSGSQEALAEMGRCVTAYRLKVRNMTQKEMVAAINEANPEAGMSFNTYRRIEDGSPGVAISAWLAVIEYMGALTGVVAQLESKDAALDATLNQFDGYGS